LKTFSEPGVSDSLIKGLEEIYINCSAEIQIIPIPFLIQNSKDFIRKTTDGTDKTAAFGQTVLSAFDPDGSQVLAQIDTTTHEIICQYIN
jgi:ATP-dependent RNA helicase DeaD